MNREWQGHIGCPVLYYPASSAACADENRIPLAGTIVSIFEGGYANIQTLGDGRSEIGGMQTSVQCCEGQENTPGRWRTVPWNQTLMVRAGCLLASQTVAEAAAVPDEPPAALPDPDDAVADTATPTDGTPAVDAEPAGAPLAAQEPAATAPAGLPPGN